jgi:hypothetical protein
MRILDRYVLRELLPPFVLGLGGFLVILVGDILYTLAEYIVSGRVTFEVVVRLLAYKMPAIMVITFPVSTLFTTFTGQTRAVFFEGEAPSLTLTGGRIIYDRTLQAVRVEGGLSITTAHGETLRARAGTWDQESQAVELTGDVEAEFPLTRRP